MLFTSGLTATIDSRSRQDLGPRLIILGHRYDRRDCRDDNWRSQAIDDWRRRESHRFSRLEMRARRAFILGPPCICACTHTRGRTTKASYFTGTVAISVNTIKPSVHVPRLRQSRGVWKYVQEAYTLFSSRAESEGKREREKERRRMPLDSSKVVDGKLRFMAFRLYRRESTTYGREEHLFQRIGRDTIIRQNRRS